MAATGDGYLDLGEMQRAFRAIGLQKRSGKKLEVDQQMFNSFDTNGDGVVDFTELSTGLSVLCSGSMDEKARPPHARSKGNTCEASVLDSCVFLCPPRSYCRPLRRLRCTTTTATA